MSEPAPSSFKSSKFTKGQPLRIKGIVQSTFKEDCVELMNCGGSNSLGGRQLQKITSSL
jgi:hypothetical protein